MMTRRKFLAAAAAQVSPAPSRLNLLYILVDQLSGLALPLHDSNARMPNCARLAESGVTFSHAYTGAMTCGPSRACLDTGLYTQAHSVGGGYRPPATLETLPKSLVRHGYVSSHPDG